MSLLFYNNAHPMFSYLYEFRTAVKRIKLEYGNLFKIPFQEFPRPIRPDQNK